MVKSNKSPLISFITASFNSENSIERTINSILSQKERNFEYIVVDGGSTDGTKGILQDSEEKFKSKKIEFKWISEKDKGIYDAWNKGLILAKGAWISFIGSDDIFYSQVSTVYAREINLSPTVDFIAAKAKMVDGNKLVREFGEKWNWNIFKKEMKILHAGGLHNKKYFDRYGFFDDGFKITGDYELLLRAKKNLKVLFIDQFLIEMSNDGVSSKEVVRALNEARKAKIKNGVRSNLLSYLDMYNVYFKVKLKELFI